MQFNISFVIFMLFVYNSYIIFIPVICSRIPIICHSCVTHMCSMSFYITRMYSYVISMSLVYIHMYWQVNSMYLHVICMSVVFIHILWHATHMYLHVICMSLICHLHVTRIYLYVIRLPLVCTHMSSAYHSYLYVFEFHLYVNRVYSYVIRMSLVCTRMSSVCHSYVLVCHPYVTSMYSQLQVVLP